MTKIVLYGIIAQVLAMNLLLANESKGQKTSIEDVYLNLNLENVPISKAFSRIERQTNFYFSYYEEDIKRKDRITIKAKNSSLADVLREISQESSLNFKRINGNIYVSNGENGKGSVSITEEIGNVLNQQKINGTVTSAEDNQPLPGVSILVKGTTNGTITNIDGKFTLDVPEEAILQFSFVGFLSQEIKITNQSTLNVVLEQDLEQLEEVVVIGYGTQKKSDITGSISSVKSDEIEKAVVPSVDQALQGRASGVYISNASGGAPGAAPTVRIRGSNSVNSGNEPLYVIDGLLVYPNNNAVRGSGDSRTDALSPNTSNLLASIDPNDIESIEVLKDASATAIYGSRGANGVIVITTKRGKTNQNNLNIDFYSGVSSVTNKFPLLNAAQYAQAVNDFNAAYDVAPAFTDEEIREYQQNGGTDWQDQIFTQALTNNIQLSSNGGNEKLQHYLSASYYDEEGVIKGSRLKRYSIRANIDYTPTEKLKMGNSFTTSYMIENAVPNGGRLPGTGPGVVYSAAFFPPTDPVYNPDGSYFMTPTRSNNAIANPVAMVETQDITYKTLRSLGTFYFDYEFFNGLSARVNLGYDLMSRNEQAYYPSETTLLGLETGGTARITDIQDVTWMTDFLLTYNKKIENHSFNIMTGVTAQANTLERHFSGRSNFVTDAFGTSNLAGGATEIIPQSSSDHWSLASWIGRMNYSFNDKYLVTFSGRYDGSSRFGENNKWAFFPSGALGWRVSQEPFMENLSGISNLKLRASWGITGNQEIGLYRSLPRYQTVGEVFGSTSAVGVRPSRTGIPNPDLTWEKTEQINIGADFGFLNDFVTASVDLYKKTTDDLLLEFPVATASGFSSVLLNSGSVENKGVEVELGTRVEAGKLGISIDLNYSYNQSKVLDLGGQDTLLTGNSQAHIVGQPLGSIFTQRFAGIWQLEEEELAEKYNRMPGDVKIEDINMDTVYNAGDRQVLGNSIPTHYYGMNLGLDYKGFDLNIFFQGSAGNIISGGTQGAGFGGANNGFVSSLDYWTETNPSNTLPSLASSNVNGNTLEKADFLRLKNVMLGYNFPAKITDKMGLSRLRIYVAGQNLLTFTNYSGQDPEVLGRTEGLFPFARNYRVGLNVGF